MITYICSTIAAVDDNDDYILCLMLLFQHRDRRSAAAFKAGHDGFKVMVCPVIDGVCPV